MKPISAEAVEKIYLKMWQMTEQEAYNLSYRLQKEQPLLVAYLAAVDQDILNQEEREILFYQGAVVWQIMQVSGEPLPQITEDMLLNIEKENKEIADSLKGADTVMFADLVKRILTEFHQPEVFKYVVGALLDRDNEDCVIRDESLGAIMLDLKTVIDCFDRQV